MLKNDCFEKKVLIVGASISGSIAANLLGSLGYRVTLVDPHIFPRRKACGEGLSIIGKTYLDYLGLWSQELESAAIPFFGYQIISSDGKVVDLFNSSAGISPQGFGISRHLLDSYLHHQAISNGNVEIISAEVSNATKFSNGWQLETSNGLNLTGSNLIFACSGGLNKILGSADYGSSSDPRFGLAFWSTGHWPDQMPSRVIINNQPEGQYIFTPISETETNCSLLLNRSFEQKVSKHSLQSKATELLTNEGFIITATSDSLGAAAIHSAKLRPKDVNAFVIGDAVERFDPISGMGMTHGIYSALLAAQAISDQGLSQAEQLALYYKQRERGARILRLLTSLAKSVNFTEKFALAKVAASCPQVAFKTQNLVKKLFPQIGTFRPNQEKVNLSELAVNGMNLKSEQEIQL